MLILNLFGPTDYKNKPENYMAVVLVGCHAKLYAGNGKLLQKIALVAPDFMNTSVREFMEHIDDMLGTFLYFYPLPVFIFGSTITISHFKNVTSHKENIVHFFTGFSGGITEDAIKQALRTSLNNQL